MSTRWKIVCNICVKCSGHMIDASDLDMEHICQYIPHICSWRNGMYVTSWSYLFLAEHSALFYEVVHQLLDLKHSIGPNIKDQYMKIHPPGDKRPPARFYSLPKIHKGSISVRVMVTSCGTSTNKLAKFLTIILHLYCDNNFSFVKDSKGLAESLKEKGSSRWNFGIFDVSALFTSVLIPVTIEVKSRKFTEHINQKRNWTSYAKTRLSVFRN